MIPQLIIALTLVAEAGGVPSENAMSRVYTVIHNRSNGTVEDMAKVCLKPHQFSCWSDNSLMERSRHSKSLPIALQIVKKHAVRGEIGQARHYLASFLYRSPKCPKWAKTGRITYDEGPKGHVFLEGVK